MNSNYSVQEKLSKAEAVTTREDYQDLYDDVAIESKQAMEMCNIYKDILTVTMDAYGSMISNNANDSMKKLTVITVLLAIPTMIAGFWGMNVVVPGQIGEDGSSSVWFWIILAATLVLTVAVGIFLGKFMRSGGAIKRTRRARRRKDKDKK